MMVSARGHVRTLASASPPMTPHDLKRAALFDLLEHELDWAPVTRTLSSAVSAADPRLLPGEELRRLPPLPIAPPRHSHQPRSS